VGEAVGIHPHSGTDDAATAHNDGNRHHSSRGRATAVLQRAEDLPDGGDTMKTTRRTRRLSTNADEAAARSSTRTSSSSHPQSSSYPVAVITVVPIP
jgi:hypothetical protein